MDKLEQTKKALETELANHLGSTGLFFSAGADSLLLLHMLIELQAGFSTVCFEHTFTKEQKEQLDEWIVEYEMRVFSYSPANVYLIGNDEEVSLIEEYAMLGGVTMPFIRDCVHDDRRCAVDDVTVDGFLPVAPIGFSLNLFGVRSEDRHYAVGNVWKTQRSEPVSGFVYLAPLWDWTKAEVLEGLAHYHLQPPKLDTGDLPVCLNCLKGSGTVFCPKTGTEIPALDWQPKQMLEAFQAKYGV
jgi:hypothetical protein